MKESTYHYHASKGEEDKDRDLKQEILNIFKESRETYGYRRVLLVLKNKGYLVNHKKVLRIMRDLNLKCTKFKRRSRKYSSYKGEVGKVADNLIQRQFSMSRVKEKLCTDVTEMKCKDGKKLCLSPIIDLYNSEIIAYGMNNSFIRRNNFKQSMSRKLLWDFETINALWREIIKYIEYYNNVRVKEKLNGMSPVQYREHITQLIA